MIAKEREKEGRREGRKEGGGVGEREGKEKKVSKKTGVCHLGELGEGHMRHVCTIFCNFL